MIRMNGDALALIDTARPGDDGVTEEDLMTRLAGGEAQALAILYERHSGAGHTVAMGLLHDPHTAQDVVQEAFLSLWQHAKTFDARRGGVRSWILSIVRHRALDLLRSACYRRRMPDGDEQLLALHDHVMVEGEVIRRCERGSLWAAIARLPAAQRQVVELAYFGGYPYPEIAAILGLPLPTVKSRLRLALHKLRAAPEVQGLQAVS
jgi:RNA polymerase sigma-70 factor (ECF subfamily)